MAMADEIYRRCRDCPHEENGATGIACGGLRFIPVGIAVDDLAKLVRQARTIERLARSMRRMLAESRDLRGAGGRGDR
jgi:hypothetical protein